MVEFLPDPIYVISIAKPSLLCLFSEIEIEDGRACAYFATECPKESP